MITGKVDFKALFEAAPDLYLVLSPELRILAASDAYLKATLVQRDQILGRDLFDVFPDNPDDPTSKGTSNLRASLNRVLALKQGDTMAIQKYDVRRPQSEGGGFEERHWSPLNCPVFDANGEVAYIIHRVEDVTDLVKLRRERIEQFRLSEEMRSENDRLEKLRQGQRMEAMGALAGGVAHDFNNILAVIVMSCESALKSEEISEPVRRELQQILESSERAASLTRQLLAFSRKQVLQPKALNLNFVLASIHEMLSRLLKENIELKIEAAKDLKSIVVDQGQLEQVILNLIVNARDAMPKGGRITIETSNIYIDEAVTAGHLTIAPGPHVMLCVRDTGVGMDAQTQARIFEPFFTTKSDGSGTGLGLATVYGIVKQNKGNIWVYSEPQKGTVFKIYFPQASAEAIAESARETTNGGNGKTNKKHGTVLIVEDQEPLRRAMISVLSQVGYTIHQAPNGVEALKILGNLDYKVDLLVTDVIMPEMGGQELAARLKSLGHPLRILFLSGFTGDVLSGKSSNDHEVHFLEKPFNHRTLLDKVASLLH